MFQRNIYRTKLKFILPAQNLKLTAELTSALGQYGFSKIEVQNFCELFNNKSSIYEKDTLLPTYILIKYLTVFDLIIKNPSSNHLLLRLNLKNKNKNFICLKDLYKMFLIKTFDFQKFNISINMLKSTYNTIIIN